MSKDEWKPDQGQILMMGDSAVGKTSLIMKFCDEGFKFDTLSTLGVDFKLKQMQVKGNPFKLKIWDTAGQEKFRSMAQNFAKKANGVAFVFDLSKKNTFYNIQNWVDQMKDFLPEGCHTILIGNKADLEHEVSKDEIEKVAQTLHCKYFEASAFQGLNVNEAFGFIAEQIYDNMLKQFREKVGPSNVGANSSGGVKITNEKNTKDQNGGCKC